MNSDEPIVRCEPLFTTPYLNYTTNDLGPFAVYAHLRLHFAGAVKSARVMGLMTRHGLPPSAVETAKGIFDLYVALRSEGICDPSVTSNAAAG